MVSLKEAQQLLSTCSNSNSSSSTALPERDQSSYQPLHRFDLATGRQYQQQFGDMYFLRLNRIKPVVERMAETVFGDVVVNTEHGPEHATKVERVLDVRQGELCWVAGTVYMDMPFKPNILEDVSRDRLLSRPTPVAKYIPEDDQDDLLAEGRGRVALLLEDDSGRIRLVGRPLASALLVTGCIIAVMGTENQNGEFEVLDLVFPDLPPQPTRWCLGQPPPATDSTNAAAALPPTKRGKVKSERDDDDDGDDDDDDDMDAADEDATRGGRKMIAIVSGLNLSGPQSASAVETGLLLEYLLGEALAGLAQAAVGHISRLIMVGNSIASAMSSTDSNAETKAGSDGADLPLHKKYGYDSSAYNPVPSAQLDAFLAELLPSMPVTLLPGAHDPSNASVPQQPIHMALFPQARVFSRGPPAAAAAGGGQAGEPGWLDAVTNPWEGEVDGWRVLATSGQTIDDIQKYMLSSDRLGMMEATCRWRCSAPTAPDTLWSYPFQEDDPFVMDECPHLYIVGSQPAFGTRVITGQDGQMVRLVAVPAFSETHELVLVDSETLQVSVVKIARA